MDLTGLHVVVMGLGRSGRAAARLALERGARVTAVDRADAADPVPGAAMELGPHRRETFTTADVVVVSPGIPAAQPDLVSAIEAGVDVVGELGFAARFVDVPIVAITGTNGKSSVTSFTGHLLQAAGFRTFVGGNFGVALSELPVGAEVDVAVVEVSSYQLELPGGFHPAVGVVLNLTPDHLQRHGTMEAYGQTKARLFSTMTPQDLAILPDDPALVAATAGARARRAALGSLPGVERRGRQATVDLGAGRVGFDLTPVTLQGAHNLDHVATSLLLATALGADPARLQDALAGLVALPHRMEPVGETDGVLWINDSKATNVASAEVGISGVERRAVVLVGGRAKGRGFAALGPALARHRAVIAFGEAAEMVREELAEVGVDAHLVPGMGDAVVLARTLARRGDAILLSPGGSSFDEFDHFEQRGDVFRRLAEEGR